MGESGQTVDSSGAPKNSEKQPPNSLLPAFLFCLALATMINSIIADVRMRLRPTTTETCEKIDGQMWSCDRSGNVFLLFKNFNPVDSPLVMMIYFRGNYILWPRHVIPPDFGPGDIAHQLLFSRTIPPDQWLNDNAVRTLLVYIAGEIPPNALVYAWQPTVSIPPISAPKGPENPATPQAIAWCYVYVLVLLLCGYAMLSLFGGPAPRGGFEILGASTGLGAAFVSLALILISMLGVVPSRTAILALGVIALAVLAVLAFCKKLVSIEKTNISWLNWRPMWLVLPFLVVLYGITALTIDSVFRPTTMWDAFAIWQLKAKVLLYQSLHSHPSYFTGLDFSYSHLRYPLLVPMLSSGVHAVVGHVDEILDKAPCLLLFLAMGAMVYNLIRSRRGRPAAMIATALLLTVQPELYLGGTGTADMAMTALAAGSFVFLLRWIYDRRCGDLALLILFSIACMWTKNEGRAIAAGNVLVFWLTSQRPWRAKSIGLAMLFALILAVSYLPWAVYTHDLPRSDEDYDNRLMSISNVIQCLPHLPHVTKAVLMQLLDIKLWGALWLLPPLMTLFAIRRALQRPVIALWLVMVLQMAAWIAAFIVTPLNFDTLLPATGLRLLMQLAPAAVLLIGLLWPGSESAEDSALPDKISPAALQPVLPV